MTALIKRDHRANEKPLHIMGVSRHDAELNWSLFAQRGKFPVRERVRAIHRRSPQTGPFTEQRRGDHESIDERAEFRIS